MKVLSYRDFSAKKGQLILSQTKNSRKYRPRGGAWLDGLNLMDGGCSIPVRPKRSNPVRLMSIGRLRDIATALVWYWKLWIIFPLFFFMFASWHMFKLLMLTSNTWKHLKREAKPSQTYNPNALINLSNKLIWTSKLSRKFQVYIFQTFGKSKFLPSKQIKMEISKLVQINSYLWNQVKHVKNSK